MFISEAFAQTAPAATAAADSPFGSMGGMIFPLLMVAALYFVVLRPQMKRQKEHKSMIEAIAKGDEVVIAGGMLGKISKLGDTYLSVEVANGVEVQVQRASVVQVLPNGDLVVAGPKMVTITRQHQLLPVRGTVRRSGSPTRPAPR